MQNQARNLVIVALIAALVVIAAWRQLPGEVAVAKPATVKWDYQIVAAGVTKEIRDLGADGWEVCAAYSDNSGGTRISGHIILKRQKDAE